MVTTPATCDIVLVKRYITVTSVQEAALEALNCTGSLTAGAALLGLAPNTFRARIALVRRALLYTGMPRAEVFALVPTPYPQRRTTNAYV